MSMSQEEIEALMNGLDIEEESSEPESDTSENTNLDISEIDDLISNTQVDNVENKIETPVIEEPNGEVVNNDDIDALLKGLEEENNESSEIITDSDDLLKELESTSETQSMASEDDIDAMLSQIDGITDDEKPIAKVEEKKEINPDDLVRDWTDSKINEGVFPLPAEADTKVVNQLNQVANDSEEKVGQIFDVLSLGLDNNNDFRNKITEVESFIESEKKLLESLSSKFPNIGIFSEHLAKTDNVISILKEAKNTANEEDMKIFEAMELMQFNDINRQKIERVMSVIRKLSLYLNNLFEDEYSDREIAVAKHIHGDNSNDLIGDDLDKLIEEFAK